MTNYNQLITILKEINCEHNCKECLLFKEIAIGDIDVDICSLLNEIIKKIQE